LHRLQPVRRKFGAIDFRQIEEVVVIDFLFFNVLKARHHIDGLDIRAKVVAPQEMENAPASLHSLDVKSRDMRGQKYVSSAMLRFSQRVVPMGQVPSGGSAETGSASPRPASIAAVTVLTKSGAASETTGGINTVMQMAFFHLTQILPGDSALAELQGAIAKSYSSKGQELVEETGSASPRPASIAAVTVLTKSGAASETTGGRLGLLALTGCSGTSASSAALARASTPLCRWPFSI
jgi:hypothetical protein